GEISLHAEVNVFPEIADPTVICDVQLTPARGGERDPRAAGLAAVIRQRFTNRRVGARVPLHYDDAAALNALAEDAGARLELLSDVEPLQWIAELLGRGDRLRYLSRPMHREM